MDSIFVRLTRYYLAITLTRNLRFCRRQPIMYPGPHKKLVKLEVNAWTDSYINYLLGITRRLDFSTSRSNRLLPRFSDPPTRRGHIFSEVNTVLH